MQLDSASDELVGPTQVGKGRTTYVVEEGANGDGFQVVKKQLSKDSRSRLRPKWET